MEINSYPAWSKTFSLYFSPPLEPQGGSRDDRNPILIVLNLSLIQTLGSVTGPWALIGGILTSTRISLDL